MMGMYEHSLGGANELIAASPAYSRAGVGTEYLSPYPSNTHGDLHTHGRPGIQTKTTWGISNMDRHSDASETIFATARPTVFGSGASRRWIDNVKRGIWTRSVGAAAKVSRDTDKWIQPRRDGRETRIRRRRRRRRRDKRRKVVSK